ncbi:MAG TPA: AAA family ATPase [Polyangiales bacterium]|nr:AAA family ATPase [Polyangiales bacterium]
MSSLVQDLVAQGFALRETHISQVFLGDDSVYKIKKPVALGFLDFSTLARREHFCAQEVVLNRRLAPDVYRGVVAITRDASGTHRIGGDGPTVEWAVHMRRLPERDAADVRLGEGRLERGHLQHLAEHIARFHSAARCDAETAQHGSPEAIERNVRENFEQTRQSARRFLDERELAQLESWQLGFLAAQRERFLQRVADHRIRDGHGDLRLEHGYLDDAGGVEIIDCIEFNERFRYGDVCADVAFLAMDLAWHERRDASEIFLADYARATGDYDLYGLVDFYQSYRAFVRGKVSSLLEADAGASSEARAHAGAQARKYYLLAEACAREPLERPVLCAVGGLIASGKSTLANRLVERIAAPAIDSDRTRKQLAGVDPLTPLPDAAFSGHYGPEASAATYAELRRRAEVVLRSKRSVILDASFRTRAERRAVHELAQRCGAGFLFIECSASPATVRARLAQRVTGPSISDGRPEIFAAFAQSYEPVDELPEQAYLQLDTDQREDAALERALERLR